MFVARLKPANRQFLDALVERYSVRSAAAALNRLLDQQRRVENDPKIVIFGCPKCGFKFAGIDANPYAVCQNEKCCYVWTLVAPILKKAISVG